MLRDFVPVTLCRICPLMLCAFESTTRAKAGSLLTSSRVDRGGGVVSSLQ